VRRTRTAGPLAAKQMFYHGEVTSCVALPLRKWLSKSDTVARTMNA
jgi:hypothetical protein